jgi:hypothetical protein
MAQISRPFQIALAAVALLGLVWVFALHRSSGSPSAAKAAAEREVAAATPTKASAAKGSAAAGGKAGGSSSRTYHGSAPGVAGLTGAVAKAHGAVATSQKNAKQLEEKSAQASSSAAPTSSHASTTPASSASPARTSAPARSHSPSSSHSKTPSLARQHLVEDELAQGRIVALLFWSSKGADDIAVKGAIEHLAKSDHGISVHLANAQQVASFGTITRGVEVYGTPTILIVGKHGQTRTLTGLQDAYAIQQAISEARHA